MHEFALTQNLRDLALKNADSKRIGPFSDEQEDSIEFYWKDLAKGSLGERAELHFEHVKAVMKCLDCSRAFSLEENEEATMCKYCFSAHLQLLSGDDVRLESIEVE